MVKQLPPPKRPLSKANAVWTWTPGADVEAWQWCRVYHRSSHTPDGITFRRYGPLYRFDHHHAADPPQVDPEGRRIPYGGEDLATWACEVFGEAGVAAGVPKLSRRDRRTDEQPRAVRHRRPGCGNGLGALPALAAGNEKWSLTQEWARAISEDKPAGPKVVGVHYLSAYNRGNSSAMGDCDGDVEVVRDARGLLQDFPLSDPRVFGRFQKEMTVRHINVTTVSASGSKVCNLGP